MRESYHVYYPKRVCSPSTLSGGWQQTRTNFGLREADAQDPPHLAVHQPGALYINIASDYLSSGRSAPELNEPRRGACGGVRGREGA